MLAKPAFELLYRRHWYELYCIACRQTGSRHDAEELVQALFEKIWARRDDLDVRHWGAFLAASLNNLIVDFHRRRQLQEKFLQQYNTPADIESPHEDLDHQQLREVIDDALGGLPEKTRVIFKLSRYEHKSVKEIAGAMQLTEKAVEYHITKSIRLLRHHLRNYLNFFLTFF